MNWPSNWTWRQRAEALEVALTAAQQRVAVLKDAIDTALQEIDAAKHVSIYSSKCDVCKATAKLRTALASTEPITQPPHGS